MCFESRMAREMKKSTKELENANIGTGFRGIIIDLRPTTLTHHGIDQYRACCREYAVPGVTGKHDGGYINGPAERQKCFGTDMIPVPVPILVSQYILSFRSCWDIHRQLFF